MELAHLSSQETSWEQVEFPREVCRQLASLAKTPSDAKDLSGKSKGGPFGCGGDSGANKLIVIKQIWDRENKKVTPGLLIQRGKKTGGGGQVY